MRAWNCWYHCIGSTYGSWLPGDPRGWRSRHHRTHVEGDYKNPPLPGTGSRLHERAKNLMSRDAVVLDARQREIVLDELRQTLEYYGVPVAALTVSATHAHVLARFERGRRTGTGKPITDPPRHFFGLARKRAARRLSDLGLATGGVWSKRTKVVPITDRDHLDTARRYILDHATEGALVWHPPP